MQFEWLSILQVIDQSAWSREQKIDAFSESIFLMIGLLSPNQATRNNERCSF